LQFSVQSSQFAASEIQHLPKAKTINRAFSSKRSIFSDFQQSTFGDEFAAIRFVLSDLSLGCASFPRNEKSSQFL